MVQGSLDNKKNSDNSYHFYEGNYQQSSNPKEQFRDKEQQLETKTTGHARKHATLATCCHSKIDE